MSDLDEIAKAAGIAIIDEHSNDRHSSTENNRSAKNNNLQKILELEDIFCNRYTDADLDYIKTIEDSSSSTPPCITDFYVRHQRDDSRKRFRNWGGHHDGDDRRNSRFLSSHHHDGGDMRDSRYQSNRGRNQGWNRDNSRSYGRPGNYGDFNREERDSRHRDRSPHS